MKRKDVLKWIKREAKKLPEESRVYREYYYKRDSVIDSEIPHFISEDGRLFKPEEGTVNHARQLKNIWDKTQSFEELNKYFMKFNMQLNYGS